MTYFALSSCRSRAAAAVCVAVATLTLASGCQTLSGLRTDDRFDKGYTILLPGILGHQPWDDNLANGLDKAGVPTAIEVVDWTNGPLAISFNALDVKSNQKKAHEIAGRIVEYQDRYPGRPVHLVGHSGGANMAVLTLQALPPNRRIESAVLLAPGMPKDFDLRPAMAHTRSGIHNFYSPYDLLISTLYLPSAVTTFQNHDLRVAGAAGFVVPDSVAEQERASYERGLKQHAYDFEMVQQGHLGDHFGWTNPEFVAKWIAPVIAVPNQPQPAVAAPSQVPAPASTALTASR